MCLADDAAGCGAALPEPGVEVCSGVDDDCDGSVDEGFGVGEGCAVGVGACRVEGWCGARG
ncbi:MAG: hypothetical protein R3F65_28805 [bacterium]